MNKRKELKDMILKLSFELEKQYNLNFKNHCYLRIAYDNIVKDKWSNKIKPSFLNNCSIDEMFNVYELLDKYKTDKELLLIHNKKSLIYRNKIK